MSDIMNWLEVYRLAILIVIALFSLFIVLVANKDWVSFQWLQFRYGFLGKLTRLSKNAHLDADGWFDVEKSLCDEFMEYHRKHDVTGAFYNKSKDYLNKANEVGRRNLPWWGWLILSALVFLEAMGFSYVLAGYTIPGASEHVQQYGALGISFIVSCILVLLTHFMGHELYKNSLISKINTWFKYNRKSGDKKTPNNKITIETTMLDDNKSNWQQLLNRVETNASVTQSHIISKLTIVFIILIAVGATYVRGTVLEKELIAQHQQTTANPIYVDPYDATTTLPADLAKEQQNIDNKINAGIESETRRGGWGTFIVLAVIFIFLQIMGILIGFKHGFAGKESEVASWHVAGFDSSDQFESYHKRLELFVGRIAQSYLQKLQIKITDHNNSHDNAEETASEHSGERTFSAYVRKKEDATIEGEIHRAKKNKESKQTIDAVKKEENNKSKEASDEVKEIETKDDIVPTSTERKPMLTVEEIMKEYSLPEEQAIDLYQRQKKKADASKEDIEAKMAKALKEMDL